MGKLKEKLRKWRSKTGCPLTPAQLQAAPKELWEEAAGLAENEGEF